MKNILFITNSKNNRIEFSVVENASRSLNRHSISCKSNIYVVNNLLRYLILFSKIKTYDIIVFHSPFFYFYPIIYILNLLNFKTVGIIWDIYPVTLSGKRYNSKLVRRFIDFLENKASNSFLLKVVPSSDFKFNDGGNKIIIKLWPPLNLKNFKFPKINFNHHHPLKIIFCGQINETRGLFHAFNQLMIRTSNNFILYVASNDVLPMILSKNSNIIHMGFHNKKSLRDFISKCDFGLVSLNPCFDGPAFPSKTFDYIESGLPILYSGPKLEAYESALELSGVGINISKCVLINHSLGSGMRIDFLNKMIKFQKLTCLSSDEIQIFEHSLERL